MSSGVVVRVLWARLIGSFSSWSFRPHKQAFQGLAHFCIALKRHWNIEMFEKEIKMRRFSGLGPPPPFFFFFELTYLAYLYVLSEYGDGPLIIRCQQYVSYLLFNFMYVWLHHDLDLENTALSSGSNRAKYGLQNDNALMYIANITSWCYTFLILSA